MICINQYCQHKNLMLLITDVLVFTICIVQAQIFQHFPCFIYIFSMYIYEYGPGSVKGSAVGEKIGNSTVTETKSILLYGIHFPFLISLAGYYHYLGFID